MKTVVYSYSLTGNNDVFAKSIAHEIKANHVKITESITRSTGKIVVDMLFNRTPLVNGIENFLSGGHDLVIVVGPVWMGHVAAPLRPLLKQLKAKTVEYAFISISGGALGPNPKLAAELEKRTGRAPTTLIDLHIADLLPPGAKPSMKDTAPYRLTENDVRSLTAVAVKSLKEAVEI